MSHFLFGVELYLAASLIVYVWYRFMQWIGKH